MNTQSQHISSKTLLQKPNQTNKQGCCFFLFISFHIFLSFPAFPASAYVCPTPCLLDKAGGQSKTLVTSVPQELRKAHSTVGEMHLVEGSGGTLGKLCTQGLLPSHGVLLLPLVNGITEHGIMDATIL